MPKWALANSMDLYLYPRLFEPLFRGFFGKAALFCTRQSVEFRPAFLLVMPNTHSKHRCQRVSRLCGISDVKTAGKPHPHFRTKPRRIGDAGTRESKPPVALATGGRLSAGSQQSIGFYTTTNTTSPAAVAALLSVVTLTPRLLKRSSVAS